MARPMVLIQEPLLSELWYKASIGVPVSTLIEQEQLNISPPTLTKLLKCLTALEETTDDKVYSIIHSSLFPAWLEALEDVPIVSQPSAYKYIGQFPLGKWISDKELNDETNERA